MPGFNYLASCFICSMKPKTPFQADKRLGGRKILLPIQPFIGQRCFYANPHHWQNRVGKDILKISCISQLVFLTQLQLNNFHQLRLQPALLHRVKKRKRKVMLLSEPEKQTLMCISFTLFIIFKHFGL